MLSYAEKVLLIRKIDLFFNFPFNNFNYSKKKLAIPKIGITQLCRDKKKIQFNSYLA